MTVNYLIFELHATRYALPAQAVQTTFWLPALSPVEDLPEHFVGLVNLHGEVLAVVDLARRFGHPARAYGLHQPVILLSVGARRLGLVVDQVLELVEVAPQALSAYVELDAPELAPEVIAGSMRWHDAVLILLDASALARWVLQVDAGAAQLAEPGAQFGALAEPARQQLRERTRALAAPAQQAAQPGRAHVLVRIGASRYAIDIAQVAEFVHLEAYSPVPGCPPQVLGCINLRGRILTVLDLAALQTGQSSGDYREVVVLALPALRVGLAAHQIEDIRWVDPAAVAVMPQQAHGGGHCAGMLLYDDGVAGVLDVQALLDSGHFDVNEPA